MIHYKFKNTNSWSRLSTDGGPFTVLDLKREIVKQKKLNKGNADFDLVITDAQSGVAYTQDGFLIPRNAALIVRRVPPTHQKSLLVRMAEEDKEEGEGEAQPEVEEDGFGDDIYADKDKDKTEKEPPQTKQQEEEAKMLAVLNKAAQYKSFGNRSVTFGGAAATEEARKGGAAKTGGRHEFGENRGVDRSRVPPPYYVCNRCNKPGHFIRFCPTNGDPDFDPKRPRNPTGIPRSFLQPITQEAAETEPATEEEEKKLSGGTVMIQSEKNGQKVTEFFVARPNVYEFQKFFGKDGTKEGEKEKGKKRSKSSPDPLIVCLLCNRIFENPMAVSCCFTTFCDECIRQVLVSGGGVCPICALPVSPEDLMVNRGLRVLVDNYKASLPPPDSGDPSASDLANKKSVKRE